MLFWIVGGFMSRGLLGIEVYRWIVGQISCTLVIRNSTLQTA
jgi:hypothetical protein